MNKFLKPESNSLLNDVDYFNMYGSFSIIFQNEKDCILKNDTECICQDLSGKGGNDITFRVNKNNNIDILKDNPYDIATGAKISKFMLLTAVRFKGDISAAMYFVKYTIRGNEIPYIRVGVDYYKIIEKITNNNIKYETIKAWKKDEIKQDHTKHLLSRIPKYDDFIIIPNNVTYTPVVNNCYNLYSRFPHEPVQGDVSVNDIPFSLNLIKHIFGEQFELGLQYLKILYEYPKQILPVLVLVSTERETGKTTFMDYLNILFSENAIMITPELLTSDFNESYAKKNIIMIDETVIDKSSVIEKLKNIATAKTMTVNQKFVSNYTVPFFGKVIVATNKENDFMRIDEEEIRFWVRKINRVNGNKNTNILNDLSNEIPKFLKFLLQLEAPDFSRSRMVFTSDEISTENLSIVKEESKSSLYKELKIYIEDFFNENENIDSFEATPTDIKDKWFRFDSKITNHYIIKVLKEQMKMKPQKLKKYNDFNNLMTTKTGTPYKFYRENSSVIEEENSTNGIITDVPF